jgi:hypothetical protein
VTPDSEHTSNDLRRMLDGCPAGLDGWKRYESAALATLRYLFVPPLAEPYVQPRSYSGIDRRDAVFPNRITDTSNSWGLLRADLDARLILVEFKNYDREEIGKAETDQTGNYLKKSMGRLAIICCNKVPDASAHIRRNTIYSEEKKVILFVGTPQLKEMLDIKDRGEDPADLIVDYVDRFYLQHE